MMDAKMETMASAVCHQSKMRAASTFGVGCSLWLIYLCCIHQALAAVPRYEPKLWNRSCNYTVAGIPAAVFFNRSIPYGDAVFPISPGYRIAVAQQLSDSMSSVQLSCFGPGQIVNHTLVAAGIKMPCGYAINHAGTVDYWEEAVCDMSFRSNCYCYSLNVQNSKGYCIPGHTTTSSMQVNFSGAGQKACADAAHKVQLDGGRPATRQEVYAAEQPASGHFIALVVWPGNDFHFFRRDAEGWWSQKRGDTFVTNTHPNGSIVWDVEDPAILGAYTQFCGYFHVNPTTHAHTDSSWTYSSIPQRIVEVKGMGFTVASTPLHQPSTGWMRLNYPYLLFGLDAAVFDSGQRRLPWQQSHPAVITETGSRSSMLRPPSTSASKGPSHSLKPHWTSHVQHHTTVLERDQSVRAQYAWIAANVLPKAA